MRILELDTAALPEQYDESRADELRDALAGAFGKRTMAEWAEVFAGTDACVTPVLTFEEALENPHLVEREVFTSIGGVDQPRPAPRFSRTPAGEPVAARRVTEASWQHTTDLRSEL